MKGEEEMGCIRVERYVISEMDSGRTTIEGRERSMVWFGDTGDSVDWLEEHRLRARIF